MYKAKMFDGKNVLEFRSDNLETLNRKIGNYRYIGFDLLEVVNTKTNMIIF